MKQTLLYIICCLCCSCSFAITDSTLQIRELENFSGCWKGSITYLDYSTNKSFSMPAEVHVRTDNTGNSKTYSLIYPEEPKANITDTLRVSDDGRYFNGELIRTKRNGNDVLTIVTERKGVDGNDNKPALMRYSYFFDKNSYSIKKEIQFVGEQSWIIRHEYRFTRVSCN